ncbi:23S rRNA (adenine(1618)-N(6))-methyltransferase RlmF [Pelobium manganitolerans]|uniref:23S rRNA (adenine(1618)-N(6))-methyltransferase RlmF n=1 Tax=Pelobium manganitolerans TaxID=1842495 RepID=UPI003FA3A00A
MAKPTAKKKGREKAKSQLHPRNKHHGRYNLQELIKANAELATFVKVNEHGAETIDFANADAVKALNKALLQHFYDVKSWDIPEGFLCPPIPGRADYVHNVADLLALANGGKVPTGKQIKCLDIGVGANCVYPLIGTHEYGWTFIGSEISKEAIDAAQKIVDANPSLASKIKLRLQVNPKNILPGAIEKTERIHATFCNPPFYATLTEAQNASLKKLSNLNNTPVNEVKRNFGGQEHELWCHGGEGKFVNDMIRQSEEFGKSCLWFTTLISNHENLKGAQKLLEKLGAADVKVKPMGQGNKVSRILAWTFIPAEKRKHWFPNNGEAAKPDSED